MLHELTLPLLGMAGGAVMVGIAFWMGQRHERREADFKRLLKEADDFGRTAREEAYKLNAPADDLESYPTKAAGQSRKQQYRDNSEQTVFCASREG